MLEGGWAPPVGSPLPHWKIKILDFICLRQGNLLSKILDPCQRKSGVMTVGLCFFSDLTYFDELYFLPELFLFTPMRTNMGKAKFWLWSRYRIK